ncbi:hypothetical protein PoMZ_07960 [Pyricularia oryzae]|uniref:Uncharacterized protein n=1 Tax=Pyricularia oryzae TaxID=318829 RepID=A0A4P7NGE5_PYROR|nr:hypothetical protein PoMZ_07960 [Pyricularia oryzae]
MQKRMEKEGSNEPIERTTPRGKGYIHTVGGSSRRTALISQGSSGNIEPRLGELRRSILHPVTSTQN